MLTVPLRSRDQQKLAWLFSRLRSCSLLELPDKSLHQLRQPCPTTHKIKKSYQSVILVMSGPDEFSPCLSQIKHRLHSWWCPLSIPLSFQPCDHTPPRTQRLWFLIRCKQHMILSCLIPSGIVLLLRLQWYLIRFYLLFIYFGTWRNALCRHVNRASGSPESVTKYCGTSLHENPQSSPNVGQSPHGSNTTTSDWWFPSHCSFWQNEAKSTTPASIGGGSYHILR